jgi:hypothetical protein
MRLGVMGVLPNSHAFPIPFGSVLNHVPSSLDYWHKFKAKVVTFSPLEEEVNVFFN